MFKPDPLQIYCRRIGLAKAPPVSVAGLLALQEAHRRHIAFENLDVMLGRGIDLAAPAVFAKLVDRGRGGYCFEHNRLFAAMLEKAGFSCRLLLARVLLGDPPALPPLTHCLVLAEIEGASWIADTGFGGAYAPPLPLRDGAEAHSGDGARHRLRRLDAADAAQGEWLLERLGPVEATDGRGAGGGWQKQFAFDLRQVAYADCEIGNHWTSTHPAARFTNHHVVSLCLPDGFASMVDRELSVFRAGSEPARHTIGDAQDYAQVLSEVFGLDVPLADVTRLPLFAAQG